VAVRLGLLCDIEVTIVLDIELQVEISGLDHDDIELAASDFSFKLNLKFSSASLAGRRRRG
jgi:hypothetical protein